MNVGSSFRWVLGVVSGSDMVQGSKNESLKNGIDRCKKESPKNEIDRCKKESLKNGIDVRSTDEISVAFGTSKEKGKERSRKKLKRSKYMLLLP